VLFGVPFGCGASFHTTDFVRSRRCCCGAGLSATPSAPGVRIIDRDNDRCLRAGTLSCRLRTASRSGSCTCGFGLGSMLLAAAAAAAANARLADEACYLPLSAASPAKWLAVTRETHYHPSSTVHKEAEQQTLNTPTALAPDGPRARGQGDCAHAPATSPLANRQCSSRPPPPPPLSPTSPRSPSPHDRPSPHLVHQAHPTT
jgi:hypothetical protein